MKKYLVYFFAGLVLSSFTGAEAIRKNRSKSNQLRVELVELLKEYEDEMANIVVDQLPKEVFSMIASYSMKDNVIQKSIKGASEEIISSIRGEDVDEAFSLVFFMLLAYESDLAKDDKISIAFDKAFVLAENDLVRQKKDVTIIKNIIANKNSIVEYLILVISTNVLNNVIRKV
jgi:hypothetical protein